jgi:hypothetical protein
VIAFLPTNLPAPPAASPAGAAAASEAAAGFAALLALFTGEALPAQFSAESCAPGREDKAAETPREERKRKPEEENEDAPASDGARPALPAPAIFVPAPLPEPAVAQATAPVAVEEAGAVAEEAVRVCEAAAAIAAPAAPAVGEESDTAAADPAILYAGIAASESAPPIQGSPRQDDAAPPPAADLETPRANPGTPERSGNSAAPDRNLRPDALAPGTAQPRQSREPALFLKLAETAARTGSEPKQPSGPMPRAARHEAPRQPGWSQAPVRQPATFEDAPGAPETERTESQPGGAPPGQPAPFRDAETEVERPRQSPDAPERPLAARPATPEQHAAPAAAPEAAEQDQDGRNGHEGRDGTAEAPLPARARGRGAEPQAAAQPDAAPATSQTGRALEARHGPEPFRAAPHRAEAARAAAVEELTSNPPRQPLRDISIQVPGRREAASPGGDVELRLRERGGRIQVAVHTADPALKDRLREHLPELVSKLEETGYRAETWHPDAAAGAPRGPAGAALERDAGERSGRHAADDNRGDSGADSGGQQSRRDRRQAPSEWIEAIEDSLGQRPSRRYSHVR